MLSSDECIRYQSHLMLPNIGVGGQLALKNTKVLCVGAGGLGCPLLMYLAAAGVGQIGVVDSDVVCLSNLQRQILYRTSDVGQLKVNCARSSLLALNPVITVVAYAERLSLSNAELLLSPYDLIVDCSDNFETKFLINDHCHQLKKIFVSASAHQHQGYFIFLNPFDGPCYRCLFEEVDLTAGRACAHQGMFAPLLSILSALQASAVIHYAAGVPKHFNQFIEYDAETLEQRKSELRVNPYCLLKHSLV